MSRPPQLVVLESSRGSTLRSLLAYFDSVRREQPGTTVTVTIPEFVPRHWWQRLLPTHTSLWLKLALLFRPGLVVTDVPYHLQRTALADQGIHHLALVPIGELNRAALQSLAYARSITPEFIAVHVATDDDDATRLRADWERWVEAKAEAREEAVQRARAHADAWGEPHVAEAESALRRPPQLVVIDSPYRTLIAPLLAYIDALRAEQPDTTVTVVLPEFVTAHWWEFLLHNQTATRLKWALLTRPGVVVTDVPYHLPR